MLKKIFANTKAKKTSIFIAVFAITCILMGYRLNSYSDEFLQIQASIPNVETEQGGQAPEHAVMATASKGGVSSYYVGQGRAEEEASRTADLLVSQIPPVTTQPQVEFAYATADGFVYSPEIPLSYELQQHTYAKCVEYSLEYELVLALMWGESRFQIDAVNINSDGTQDSGIMQINDVNKNWLWEQHGINDLMDPIQNINAGTAILGEFSQKYGAHEALMAYQYGENGMLSKREEGVVSNEKIVKVMAKRDDFRNIIQNS